MHSQQLLYILAPDSLLTPDPSIELESPLLVCVVTAIVVVSDIARTCVLSLIFTRSVCFCELIALFLLSNRPDTFGQGMLLLHGVSLFSHSFTGIRIQVLLHG